MANPPRAWDAVLAASAKLQRIVPDAVLVGGTAAATHAHHRISFDDDHVVADLRQRFDAVLADLEATDGWITARVQRPVQILGSLDGVDTGIRNLIRRRPLEVERFDGPAGPVTVPTLAEMTRIKAWLVLQRNATRDHLDLVALAARLGSAAPAVVAGIDDWYADQRGPGGQRIVAQLCRQLADPRPYDLADVDLAHYRDLAPPWRSWATVAEACRALAVDVLATGGEGG